MRFKGQGMTFNKFMAFSILFDGEKLKIFLEATGIYTEKFVYIVICKSFKSFRHQSKRKIP